MATVRQMSAQYGCLEFILPVLVTPAWEITSPVFDKVEFNLDSKYLMEVSDKYVSTTTQIIYIYKSLLNGKEYTMLSLTLFGIAAGGEILNYLGDKPT